MAELKPCPFCGGDGVIVKYKLSEKIPFESWRAYCPKCSHCTYYREEKDAIEAWNRRADNG